MAARVSLCLGIELVSQKKRINRLDSRVDGASVAGAVSVTA